MQRKTVTVLFCDVTGSTALGESLDPEALRGVLARYFARMKTIIEQHGGTVEKFIGDAVMAVFGVPAAHEDDALRAVRAAFEMCLALPDLGVQARIGVNTGEVVTGTEERLATGDAVNVAARLEQAAPPGTVLLGAETLALVAGAVDVEPVEPLALKGKALPVPAFRLIGVRAAPERRHEAQFVGRQHEVDTVRGAHGRAVAEQRCQLVTVLADAGVGKSRLAAEALDGAPARVVRGRCLSYGEGITYWPVVEILKQLNAIPTDPAAAAAIRALLGESDAVTTVEDVAWAVRKLFEQVAGERPLAVVFDDLHWADETLLDLIEHVALLSSGAPVLLLCLARPELLDRRPSWPVTLRLEPLPPDAVADLIPQDVPPGLRERITRAAGGNPLFITEMLAVAGDADGEVAVPPTLKALLAARLDQLEPGERSVLERGAVEGEMFHRGAVQALAPDEPQLTPRLASLVRRGLIRPDASYLSGQDGFRFRHVLIRDAVYDALPKATRAELHGRFAEWLEEHGAGLVELDEVMGHHLEQSFRYRVQLGLPGGDDVAVTARQRLSAAGMRARRRGDEPAAARLLQRALAFVPENVVDLELEMELLEALFWSGRGDEAVLRARALVQRAAAAGNRVAVLAGELKVALYLASLDSDDVAEELSAAVRRALPELEAAGDATALDVYYSALAQVENIRGQMDAMCDAYERAAMHAERAGRPNSYLGWRATARFAGTTPISDLLAWLDEQAAAGRWSDRLAVRRAQALALTGRSDEARQLFAGARAKAEENGGGFALAALLADLADVELWAGNPAAAAEFGAEALRLYADAGDAGFASTTAARLGQAHYELDRLDDAAACAAKALDLGAEGDVMTQMIARQVTAKVCARRGAHSDAERLAREAVALGASTDLLTERADALADLAEVLFLTGSRTEAATRWSDAIALYERKETAVLAERARARLKETEGAGHA